MSKKLTLEEFIDKANKVHGGKYDYNKVVYVNRQTKVNITCSIHGDFEQTPCNHLNGHGCHKCNGFDKIKTEEFILKANEIHGDKYDYSNVQYVSSLKKVLIGCKEHGLFSQRPNDHLNGKGCPLCGIKKCSEKRKKTTEDFINEAIIVHGNRYDYSKVKYGGYHNNVEIICNKHGSFFQKPSKHLMGQGCPICKASSLENKVRKILSENKIEFNEQKKFKWLKNKQLLTLDFFLPQYNIAIECQGEQHYKPIKFFGGFERFLDDKNRDMVKYNLCNKHNINVLYVNKDNVNDLLNKINNGK